MWIHGIKYAEGDTIDKIDTGTAKVLLQLADQFDLTMDGKFKRSKKK